MDERFGFIHEKTDIKLLILFVLRHLPSEIDGEKLGDLVLIDGGIGYFDYKQCLAELENTAQVSRNGEILESSLPFSVRAKARRTMAPVIEEMRRREMILANHEKAEGGVTVYLAMSDGVGTIFDLKILAADEDQARRIERNFKKKAEQYYQRFVEQLSE